MVEEFVEFICPEYKELKRIKNDYTQGKKILAGLIKHREEIQAIVTTDARWKSGLLSSVDHQISQLKEGLARDEEWLQNRNTP